jgi:hypothetical protein
MQASAAKMKIYVDAPAYVANSNGLRCLYGLAQELAIRGMDISFLPRSFKDFTVSLPSEYASIATANYDSLEGGGILIAGESLPKSLVIKARSSRLRILWWYLAPEDVLDVKPIKPKSDEPVMVFSSYVGPSTSYFYYQPPLDQYWITRLNRIRKNGVETTKTLAIYSGKGRLCRLPDALLRFCRDYKIIAISRHWPKTRKDLLDAIFFCDGLISFDELSQLNLEAASLGLPVLIANKLYDSKVAEAFPIAIERFITQDPNRFIAHIVSLNNKRESCLPPSELLSCNVNTVNMILQLLSCPASLDDISYAKQQDELSSFGNVLRSRYALSPIWRGQSPGARFFLCLYAKSLHQNRLFHLIICFLARSTDSLVKPVLFVYQAWHLAYIKALIRRFLLHAIRVKAFWLGSTFFDNS